MPTGKAKDNIRLRQGPAYEAAEIGFIHVTKPVEVLYPEGDWLRVIWEGKEGYVMRKFILIADEELASLKAPEPEPEPVVKPAKKPKRK
jgi:hypothetical protein